MPGQSCPVGAGALNADAGHQTEAAHPAESLRQPAAVAAKAAVSTILSVASTPAATWRSLRVSTPPMTIRVLPGRLVSAFLSSDGHGCHHRPGRRTGLSAWSQGSHQVTSVRPAGARLGPGTGPTDQRRGTRPVTDGESGPARPQTPPGLLARPVQHQRTALGISTESTVVHPSPRAPLPSYCHQWCPHPPIMRVTAAASDDEPEPAPVGSYTVSGTPPTSLSLRWRLPEPRVTSDRSDDISLSGLEVSPSSLAVEPTCELGRSGTYVQQLGSSGCRYLNLSLNRRWRSCSRAEVGLPNQQGAQIDALSGALGTIPQRSGSFVPCPVPRRARLWGRAC